MKAGIPCGYPFFIVFVVPGHSSLAQFFYLPRLTFPKTLVSRTDDPLPGQGRPPQEWDATNGKVTTPTVGMLMEYVRHGRPLLQC
jgi:hypothetical protein